MAEFWEHGVFSLSVSKGIIVADAIGPFNVELFTRYQQELEKTLAGMAQDNWCHVAILKGLSTFTPDVIPLLESNFAWRRKHGMVSDAVVFEHAEGVNMTKEQLRQGYQKFSQDYQFFEKREDAIQWSEENLASVTGSAPGRPAQ